MTEFETAAPEVETPTNHGTDRYYRPLEPVRQLLLAGIGAVTIAGEVSDEVFAELVKRGEQTREEAIDAVRERRHRAEARRTEASSFFRSRMDDLLNRLNLPSKADVDSINAKLNILTRKVDQVQASQVDVEFTPSPPPSEPEPTSL